MFLVRTRSPALTRAGPCAGRVNEPRDSVFGTSAAVRGCHVYPDTAAIGQGDDPQWLYTVLFDGRELWGENSDPSLKVSIEAFEPYIEPA